MSTHKANHMLHWWGSKHGTFTVVVDTDPVNKMAVIRAPGRYYFDPGVIAAVPNPNYDNTGGHSGISLPYQARHRK